MKNTKPKSTATKKQNKSNEANEKDFFLVITSAIADLSEKSYELRNSSDDIAESVRAWQKVIIAFASLTAFNTIWLFIK